VFTGVSAVGNVIVTFVLVVVLTFFFMKDGDRFVPWVRRLSGERAGRHLAEVFSRWWGVLGAYVRTQLIVSLVDAVLIGIGLVIIGVPLAATLATLTFFGGFIPIVGAFVAGGVAILVALVLEGGTAALLVLGLVLLVQQLEGNVLSPWLQGRSLQLHAGIVLLAVTGGGTRYGIIGAFLAVPVVACVVVLLRYLSERVDVAARSTEPEEGGEPGSGAYTVEPGAPREPRAPCGGPRRRAGARGRVRRRGRRAADPRGPDDHHDTGRDRDAARACRRGGRLRGPVGVRLCSRRDRGVERQRCAHPQRPRYRRLLGHRRGRHRGGVVGAGARAGARRP
jgi:hypothetical protein